MIELANVSGEDDDEPLCGRLNYLASLRKISEMPEDDPDPAPDENMAFELYLSQAQFYSPGDYYVDFTVCHTDEDKDFSGIKVEDTSNNEGKYDCKHIMKTDVINQDEFGSVSHENHKWTFYLPRGNVKVINFTLIE